jgi:hypothetical protein
VHVFCAPLRKRRAPRRSRARPLSTAAACARRRRKVSRRRRAEWWAHARSTPHKPRHSHTLALETAHAALRAPTPSASVHATHNTHARTHAHTHRGGGGWQLPEASRHACLCAPVSTRAAWRALAWRRASSGVAAQHPPGVRGRWGGGVSFCMAVARARRRHDDLDAREHAQRWADDAKEEAMALRRRACGRGVVAPAGVPAGRRDVRCVAGRGAVTLARRVRVTTRQLGPRRVGCRTVGASATFCCGRARASARPPPLLTALSAERACVWCARRAPRRREVRGPRARGCHACAHALRGARTARQRHALRPLARQPAVAQFCGAAACSCHDHAVPTRPRGARRCARAHTCSAEGNTTGQMCA